MRRSFPLVLLLILVSLPSPAQKTLQSKLNKVRTKKENLRKELQKVKHQAGIVTSDIKWVDQRLQELESELQQSSNDLSGSRERQVRLSKELTEAGKRLDARKIQVAQRLRQNYMKGPTGFLSVLVGTQTVGELVSRKVLRDAIVRKDHDVFDDYRILKASIAVKKKQQDSEVVRFARLVQVEKRNQDALADAREEKTDLLQDLKGQQARIKEMIAQFEADERAIEDEIVAYIKRSNASGSKPPLPKFAGRFSKPVDGPQTSPFGYRFHPILKTRRLHTGIDFGAHSGSPIRAAADGIVVWAGYRGGYGNHVILDHGGGIMTLYGHASKLFVSSGARVKRGDRIAAVGSTGLSTAPHLHFEVRINGKPVDPAGRY